MFKTTVFAVLGSALAFGCATQEPADETQEIIDNLVQAGFQADDIQVFDGRVFTGLDAHVTLQASREMLEAGATAEQYRTTNLMSTSITRVCIRPTTAFAGNAALMTGLNTAVSRYNAQPLTFDMFVNGTSCGAVITAATTTGAGGNAGFPSGGLPYGQINIGTGTTTYGAGPTTHVISHELGHTIGFRHSDYYNRAISCGGAATNEGTAGVGAILIPGTPSTATVGGSVMNSCFSTTSTGVWTSSDVTALNYLY